MLTVLISRMRNCSEVNSARPVTSARDTGTEAFISDRMKSAGRLYISKGLLKCILCCCTVLCGDMKCSGRPQQRSAPEVLFKKNVYLSEKNNFEVISLTISHNEESLTQFSKLQTTVQLQLKFMARNCGQVGVHFRDLLTFPECIVKLYSLRPDETSSVCKLATIFVLVKRTCITYNTY